MMKKQKGSGWVLTAGIISGVLAFFSFVMFIMLAFNISGFADMYKEILFEYSANFNLSDQVTFACMELLLMFLMDAYFASFYFKGYKYKINSPQYGRALVSQSVFQMLLASFPAGLFALIGGIVMSKKPVTEAVQKDSTRPEHITQYKFEAMSEAVARLKELKDKGAISEEEYYATLNKILES